MILIISHLQAWCFHFFQVAQYLFYFCNHFIGHLFFYQMFGSICLRLHCWLIPSHDTSTRDKLGKVETLDRTYVRMMLSTGSLVLHTPLVPLLSFWVSQFYLPVNGHFSLTLHSTYLLHSSASVTIGFPPTHVHGASYASLARHPL